MRQLWEQWKRAGDEERAYRAEHQTGPSYVKIGVAVFVAIWVALALASAARANITERQARWAADYASEEGPFTVERHGKNLILLRALESQTRTWTAECPFVTDCGPCKWEQTDTRDLQVWVRKLRRGYRVRDNLSDSAYAVPAR